MPQLDKVTFYLQYSSMIFTFLFFHYFIKHTVFRTIFLTFTIRELFFNCLNWFQEIADLFLKSALTEIFTTILESTTQYRAVASCLLFESSFGVKKNILYLENLFFKDVFFYIIKKRTSLKNIESVSDFLIVKNKSISFSYKNFFYKLKNF